MCIRPGYGVRKGIQFMTIGTVLFCLAAIASAQQGGSPSLHSRCSSLQFIDLEGLPGSPTRIVSARLVQVPAEGLKQPARGMTQPINRHAVKEYCEVKGYVAPQNQFELRLPDPSDWTAKLFFYACPGFCGGLDADACNAGLSLGFASVTSNGGHYSAPGFDGLWAVNDPVSQEEFAHRGNHNVTVVAKEIIKAYYGAAAKRSYMAGCSKGGQAALIAIQRYPEDYDGVIPVAPVYDYVGRSVTEAAWVVQANDNGKGGNMLDDAAVDLVHRAVLAACDEDDGVKDEIVGDPASCKWNPADLLCKSSAARENCLTDAQVSALRKIYAPATDSAGKKLFPSGYALGSETDEWKSWVNNRAVGPSGPIVKSRNYQVAEQFLRYLAFEKSPGQVDYDPLKFRMDTDPAKLGRAQALYNATSVDLNAFRSRGGKVLIWHGWADGGIPAPASIDYYLRVLKVVGSRTETDGFLRVFLLPGVHHCAGGDGADQLDALSILDEWVEHGKAPDMIITTKTVDGKVVRTRPVYPYPKVAIYGGSGDVNDPKNWKAVDPWSGGAPIPESSGVYR
jgi:hypothetical protein